jgi:hypothetical protein
MAAPAATIQGRRWIIGRGVDLSLVIGGAGAGYLYLLLYTVFHIPIGFLWWFWSVGLDGTHIFGTASRTFFDAEARARHPKLLFGTLIACFSIGPLLVLAGLKELLALLVGVWAYYHVVRQHYGFLVLYKVKNREFGRIDNLFDRVFLGVTMVYPPFHRFFIHHPEELGLHVKWSALEIPLAIVVGLVVCAWLARQVLHPANLPKYLLLGAIVPLHWLTFAFMSWQAAVPTVTIVHNLQYHAIVWFHNRNRYGKDEACPGWKGRNLLAYAVVGLAFSAMYRVPGFELGRVSDLAFGFFCGFGLTHYYLDSRIWRVRHDPELREVLQLA